MSITACSEPIENQLPPISIVGRDKDANTADRMAVRAAEYLWARQQEDGSWRSETYGLLRSGQSLTPFVLYTLMDSHVPTSERGVDRALEFIRSRVSNRGVLGEFDSDILEYPNYATAYAIMCLKRASREQDRALITKMENYLISQQFCESNGFDKSSAAYGGWGFGGQHSDGETGHMDLVHTCRVLQTLSMEPINEEALREVQTRAQHFLKMVQKHPEDERPQPMPAEVTIAADSKLGYDGGFYFSPVVLRANKGRLQNDGNPFWKSYATATCDGLMALLASGVPLDDPRTQDAIHWLDRHNVLEFPEGIPELYEGENWREAVRFYHLSVRADVARLLGQDETRNQIAKILANDRNSDGGFANQMSALMKEDDPILCTALALRALSK